MASFNNQASANNQNPVTTFSVSNVRIWDNGGVTFSLTVDRAIIYGCRIVRSEKGDFISFPSRKGGDGKYYNHAYVKLDDKETQLILDMVSKEM